MGDRITPYRIRASMNIHASLIAIFLTLLLFTFQASAQEGERLGSVSVRKSVAKVTDAGWILTNLEVKNNGSIPIFRIEIYEYYNAVFLLGENVTVKHGNKEYMGSIPVASAGQFILQIAEPAELNVEETLSIRYWSRSAESGDFQVPTSLVWYSYSYGGNLLRTNIYSNGLLVHVKGELEQTVDRVLPYMIAAAVFVVTLFVLNYMRRNLRNAVVKIGEKRLFRYRTKLNGFNLLHNG